MSLWEKHKSFPSFFTDRLLRGPELRRPFLRVQQRLRWHVVLPEPLLLVQGGERLLDSLRSVQLHGEPVFPQEGRVPRLHEHVGMGHEQLDQILPHGPHGMFLHLTKYSLIETFSVAQHWNKKPNTTWWKSNQWRRGVRRPGTRRFPNFTTANLSHQNPDHYWFMKLRLCIELQLFDTLQTSNVPVFPYNLRYSSCKQSFHRLSW